MKTNDLIAALSTRAVPVERLARPWRRTLFWLAIAVPYIAMVIIVVQPRADLGVKLLEYRFVIEQFAAFTTAVLAAIAAFVSTIPGQSRKWLFAPLAPMILWLATLGQGCVQAWLQFGGAGLILKPDWICFPSILLAGTVPAIAMVAMLRRGAPLNPHISLGLGALAAAALGNFGLRFFHMQDASVMVLFWQLGSVFLMSALAGLYGKRALTWRHAQIT